MRTFQEWLKEMAGTGVVYDGSTGPDFQVWGDPKSSGQFSKKKKHKRKNHEHNEPKRSSS
jgi:hypothetical protein